LLGATHRAFYVDHSHFLVLAPATLAALPSTRAIPQARVFYLGNPFSSVHECRFSTSTTTDQTNVTRLREASAWQADWGAPRKLSGLVKPGRRFASVAAAPSPKRTLFLTTDDTDITDEMECLPANHAN
jgi:hypothetical protein